MCYSLSVCIQRNDESSEVFAFRLEACSTYNPQLDLPFGAFSAIEVVALQDTDINNGA